MRVTELAKPSGFVLGPGLSDPTKTIQTNWTPDTRNNGEEEYEVTLELVYPQDGGVKQDTKTASSDNPSALFSGLTQGTLYNVTIQTTKQGEFVMEPCDDCVGEEITGELINFRMDSLCLFKNIECRRIRCVGCERCFLLQCQRLWKPSK